MQCNIMLLLGLFSIAMSSASSAPCDGVFASENVAYMENIHYRDMERSKIEWESSLYKPMHDFFDRGIQQLARSGLHLIYVAPGKEAPFLSLKHRKAFRQVGKITLVDVSQKDIEEARKNIERLYPQIEVRELVLDITSGLSEQFSDYVSKEEFKSRLFSGVRNDNVNLEPIEGDILISEMVATHTGVPAIFKYKMKRKKDVRGDRKLLSAWQEYNLRSLQNQLDLYQSLLKRDSPILIATDTEKLYQSGVASESAFKPVFDFKSLDLRVEGETLWQDNVSEDSKDAHAHKVLFLKTHSK